MYIPIILEYKTCYIVEFINLSKTTEDTKKLLSKEL